VLSDLLKFRRILHRFIAYIENCETALNNVIVSYIILLYLNILPQTHENLITYLFKKFGGYIHTYSKNWNLNIIIVIILIAFNTTYIKGIYIDDDDY